MGLTFAKSVKFGALRFNFSGSGIGVSAGIPGLRLGVGPRGAYIAGGAYGFRYRQNLSSNGGATRRSGSPSSVGHGASGQPNVPHDNISSTAKHDDICVLALSDCTDGAFLQTLNEQRGKMVLWPIAAAATGALALFILRGHISSLWIAGPLMACAVVVSVWAYFRDQAKKVTALFFQLDDKATANFERLHEVVSQISSTQKLRCIEETSKYRDTKYSAGASSGLKLSKASVTIGQAPLVASNVDVPLLSTGKTTIAFFPDRTLLFQGKKVGAVEYSALSIESFNQRFIEEEAVPSDTQVVDRTWKYVNKKGGPDRRFKDNKELPVCLYNKLTISASKGLDLQFIGSRENTFTEMPQALKDQVHTLASRVKSIKHSAQGD